MESYSQKAQVQDQTQDQIASVFKDISDYKLDSSL